MRNRLRFAAVAGLILFLLGWNLPGMAAEDYTGLQYAFGTQESGFRRGISRKTGMRKGLWQRSLIPALM